MEYTIRPAVSADVKAIFDLITELAVFEKEPEAVIITEAQLLEDGFGAQPKFKCFVAEAVDGIIGIALVYMRYSTWKGEVLHLEDLIVTQSERGKGIGGALLTEVIKYGKKLGVQRIGWEVLSWNTPAIEFYEYIGADVKRGWHVVQLDAKGIHQYIAKADL